MKKIATVVPQNPTHFCRHFVHEYQNIGTKAELAERREVFKRLDIGTLFTYHKKCSSGWETPILIVRYIKGNTVWAIEFNEKNLANLIRCHLNILHWQIPEKEDLKILDFESIPLLDILGP
jgi:hypothetical protein